MLCSLFVKEKLYIGEATIATICGVIFGPHAANLFVPESWGNIDQIVLECSRIVLVVQCFAVGVELPKSYMERHWRSVVFLLVPVMTFGWLITSLFIWWMIEPLSWLESLCCAACVTATDPVLASSVVGKGKFAKRVPKHLRDILSAESGCNDGMAFPFIYLSLYLIQYRPDAKAVTFHWLCFTVLYECIFGAVYGVLVGYAGRHAIKWADRRGLIDRESFLVFYFVLALFCAGSGSLLGIDDLLVGFSCGVGFSNDGWFTQKTEESHVSNVIDLLLNLAYFVFLGSVIPWQQYNAPEIGITPWRLAVIALLVIFFRRIPIMLALKPIIPDIKNWREALFAGHFGPIGVGAIFAAILTRAELETDSTEPLADLPGPGSHNYTVIQCIWPITTFLVISSILVHGSSVAVFTLGKRINTLTLTMSYTQANEEGPSWMNRLPRIQSVSKGSMSKGKEDDMSITSSDERLPEWPPGTLPPPGLSGNFLRRQREEDNPSRSNSRPSSLRPPSKRKKWDSGLGPGGPISQSAITPQRRSEMLSPSESDTLNEKGSESPGKAKQEDSPDGLEMQEAIDRRKEAERQNPHHEHEPEVEAFEEGGQMIVEDEEGNVLSEEDVTGMTDAEKKDFVRSEATKLERETSGEHAKGKHHPHEKNEGEDMENAIADGLEHPSHPYRNLRKRFGGWAEQRRKKDPAEESDKSAHKRGPAHAYQYGNTIIVEDEDGEVVKKYDIPAPQKKQKGQMDGSSNKTPAAARQGLQRLGTWTGLGNKPHAAGGDTETGNEKPESSSRFSRRKTALVDEDDDRIRFTVSTGGRRMSKQDFIKQIQSLDPKARADVVKDSDVPESLKREAHEEAVEHTRRQSQATASRPRPTDQNTSYQFPIQESASSSASSSNERHGRAPEIQKVASNEHRAAGDNGLTLVDSNGADIPYHSMSDTLSKYSVGQPETAAQRRRRTATSQPTPEQTPISPIETTETNAERRRRLAALGESGEGAPDSDSDDDGGERRPRASNRPVEEPDAQQLRTPGIRFADSSAVSQGRVQWGEDVGVGRKGRGGR